VALATPLHALAQTKLRVFSGGQQQRPDLMKKLFEAYAKANPGVSIEVETGGSTSELQRQYLSTILNAKDPAIDVYLIDIVNPAQYYGAGWLEPLNAYMGDPATALKPYLPVYATSNVVDGKLAAMPAFADAMFMYYRRDLLDKHKIAEPKTWDELAAAAKKVVAAEGNPNLQGLSIQGAPIEGAVCTFLLPYWSQGKEFNDAAGKLTLDKAAAAKGLQQWLSLVDAGVIKKNVAEVKTGDTVNEFKAGQVLFGINWGFAWDRFKDDPDSQVKGKVGVMPLPAMAGGKSATCIGGWQWAVSAFSKNKAEAAKLVRYMSTPEASKFLAAEGSLLPTYASGVHRRRRGQGRALVQGRRQRGDGRQEPPDEPRLRPGQRRAAHHHQRRAGPHQDARRGRERDRLAPGPRDAMTSSLSLPGRGLG
jgi:multiple sugar transport system substrate-binding protein